MPEKPQRIQIRHRPGWFVPPGTVKVTRERWASPFYVVQAVGPGGRPVERPWRVYLRGDVEGQCFAAMATRHEAQVIAVELFRQTITPTYELKVQLALRGKDLACTCPHGTPCHADVLLEIANA